MSSWPPPRSTLARPTAWSSPASRSCRWRCRRERRRPGDERKERSMLTHDYSYEACLKRSVTNAWTVEDCFRGRDLDFDKPFLPDRIAGVNAIGCLTDDEKRMLNQIRGNSYCHIFAFVEEYIVPL